jgi:hypothetical protein
MMCIKNFCVLVSFSECDNVYIEQCQALFSPKKLVCTDLHALRPMAGLHGQIPSLQHSCSPCNIYTTCHYNLFIISTYSNSHTKEKSITQARKPVSANTGVNQGTMWRFHSCIYLRALTAAQMATTRVLLLGKSISFDTGGARDRGGMQGLLLTSKRATSVWECLPVS